MWFDSLSDLVRVVAVGGCAYVVLVAGARVAGKRTLAKLNAFDFVVTVALGSVLATVLLSSDVSFVEGVTAMALLFVVQWLVSQVSVRLPTVRPFLVSRPTALALDGVLLRDVMVAERITEEEIDQALRRTGRGSLEGVVAVVLESDGQLSVIGEGDLGSGSALTSVDGWPTSRSGSGSGGACGP